MNYLVISLPEHWEVTTLGNINTYKPKSVNPNKFPNELFEYYSIPSYQSNRKPSLTLGKEIESAKILLKPESVLFGKLNPRVEKVWRVDPINRYRQIGSTEWISIVPSNNVDSDFLYYLVWSDFVMPLAKNLVSGSTPSRQRVDPKSFYKIEIPLPPIAEQKRIAYVLSIVQKAISQQEQIIQTTTELKKALMQKLFTEGLHGEKQKETAIGLIPESWDVVRLDQVTDQFQYGTSVKCNYEVEGVPVLRIPNVVGGHVDIDDLKFGVPKKTEVENLRLQHSDLLFVRTNGVRENAGRCSMYRNELGNNCYYASYLIRVRLPLKELNPIFLEEYSRTTVGISFLAGQAIRTADGKFNINSGTLKRMLVPKPTIPEQEKIARIAELLDSKIHLSQSKKTALEDLFRTLLHQLMTAQIRVEAIDLPGFEE